MSTALQNIAQHEVDERRRQVEKLRLRGTPVSTIAKILNVSDKTIYRDLKAIREQNIEAVSKTEKEEHMANAMARYREIEERAWTDYHTAAEGSPARIKALDLIRVIQSDKIKALRDTGFIQNQAQKVEVEVNHKLEEVWSPELQAEVAQAMLQKALTPQLEEPVHEGEIIDAELLDDDEEEDTD